MDDPVRRVEEEPDKLLDRLRRFIDGIEDSPLLPSQFFGNDPINGEKKIRITMLKDAVREFRRYANAISETGMAKYAEVQGWIITNDHAWPYSFVNICQALHIDPEAARGALFRWKESDHGKPIREKAQGKHTPGAGPECSPSLPPQGGSDEVSQRSEGGSDTDASG